MPEGQVRQGSVGHLIKGSDTEENAANVEHFKTTAGNQTASHLPGLGSGDARGGSEDQLDEGSKNRESRAEQVRGVGTELRQMALDDDQRAIKRVRRDNAGDHASYNPDAGASRTRQSTSRSETSAAQTSSTSRFHEFEPEEVTLRPLSPVKRAEASGNLEEQAKEYLDQISSMCGGQLETEIVFEPGRLQRAAVKNLVIGAGELIDDRQKPLFIVQGLQDMATMAATQPGRRLIKEIIRLKVTVFIIEERNGSGQVKHTDERRTELYLEPVRRPSWVPDPTPSDVMMFDRLSVAAAQIGLQENDRVIYPNGVRMRAADAERIGLGPYASSPISVNAYREARGLDRQTSFDSALNEMGSNELWGGGASLEELYQVPNHVRSDKTSSERQDNIRRFASELSQTLGLDEPVVHVDAATHTTLSVHLGNTTFRANGLAQDTPGEQLLWLEGILKTYNEIAHSEVGQLLLPGNFQGPLRAIVSNKVPGMKDTRVNVRDNVLYIALSNTREKRVFDTVHENMHVRSFQRIAASGRDPLSLNNIYVRVNNLTIVEDELRARGVGPFENEKISENAYRDEVGASRRLFYGSEEELTHGVYGSVSKPFTSERNINSYHEGS